MQSEAYQEMYDNENHHWWFLARRRIVSKILTHFLPPAENREVLEIGTGSGGNLPMLAPYGKLRGVEMHNEGRKLANEKNMGEVREGNLPDNLPFDGPFDLVCLMDVLEHVEQDEASLKTIHGLLTDGGYFLITVPATPAIWSGHDVANDHFRRYTSRELRQKLLDAGFEVPYLSYFNTFLFPIVATIRITQRWLKLTPKTSVQHAPGPLNKLLTWIFGAEASLLPRFRFPIGVSLIAIAKKPSP